MSPLATEIYQQLLRRARAHADAEGSTAAPPRLTYKELAEAVTRAQPALATHPRSSALHDALGEVSAACRAADLPCLPAIVCRSGSHRPAAGYYQAAHPRVRSDAGRQSAWQRELMRISAELSSFPEVLP